MARITDKPVAKTDRTYKIVVKNGEIKSIVLTVDYDDDTSTNINKDSILISDNFDIVEDAKSISRDYEDEITIHYHLLSGYWYRSAWDSDLEWIEYEFQN